MPKTNPKNDPEWLRQKAAAEDGCDVSVGAPTPETNPLSPEERTTARERYERYREADEADQPLVGVRKLADVVPRLLDQIDALERHSDGWESECSLAMQNADYWRGRTETAESERDSLRAERDALRTALDDLKHFVADLVTSRECDAVFIMPNAHKRRAEAIKAAEAALLDGKEKEPLSASPALNEAVDWVQSLGDGKEG